MISWGFAVSAVQTASCRTTPANHITSLPCSHPSIQSQDLQAAKQLHPVLLLLIMSYFIVCENVSVWDEMLLLLMIAGLVICVYVCACKVCLEAAPSRSHTSISCAVFLSKLHNDKVIWSDLIWFESFGCVACITAKINRKYCGYQIK